VSYIDPEIENTLAVSPISSSLTVTASLSYSLAMATSPGVTVQKMKMSEGGYPGVVTASGCASDAFTPSAEVVAFTPIGDGLFAQVPVSLLPDLPVMDEVLTVPLAGLAMWIDVNQPADGTVLAVTVSCSPVVGTGSVAPGGSTLARGTFVIPADDGGLGGPPPVNPPPTAADPNASTGPGALANSGAYDPLPIVLFGGLVPLALGVLALTLMWTRRRTL
jgi:hypothetical protein